MSTHISTQKASRACSLNSKQSGIPSTAQTIYGLGGEHAQSSVGMQVIDVAGGHLCGRAEQKTDRAGHVHGVHDALQRQGGLDVWQPLLPTSLCQHKLVLILGICPTHIDGIDSDSMWSQFSGVVLRDAIHCSL